MCEQHGLFEKTLKAPWIPTLANRIKDEAIKQAEAQGTTIFDQVKAEGIQLVSSVKIKNPKYDPTWEEAF